MDYRRRPTIAAKQNIGLRGPLLEDRAPGPYLAAQGGRLSCVCIIARLSHPQTGDAS